jgi:outer membrane protein
MAKTKGTALMKRAMTLVTVGAVLIAAAAFAQQPPPQQTPPPAAAQKPAAPAAPAPPPAKPFPEGFKIAFIDVQRIASESAEGKAAAAKIIDLQQKRSNELAAKNKSVEAAQQKLSSGGALMSDDARAQLQKEIEKQQVDIQRAQQDAQGEIDELNRQLQADFQRKLGPVIQQLSTEKSLYILFSRADAGIVWADTALDLTAEVIRRFDAAMATAKPPVVPKPPKSPRP